MKAAFLERPGTDAPFVVKEVDDPIPGHGEVVVRVAGCGFCATDGHYAEGVVPTVMKENIILGHEASGTVDKVGDGVSKVKEWDVVLIPAVLTCGTCYQCCNGHGNVCEAMRMFGNHIHGSFAEKVLVPKADDLCLLPADSRYNLTDWSIVADALTTPYHCIANIAQVKPGQTVVIFGAGGVGINNVQFAKLFNAYVVVVDPSEEKRDYAERLGADLVIHPNNLGENPKKGQPFRSVAEYLRFQGITVDVAIEAAGVAQAAQDAVKCVRARGLVIFQGYVPKPAEINIGRIMFMEIRVSGSLGCRPVDYPTVVGLVEQGKVRLTDLITGWYGLKEINGAFNNWKSGQGIRSVILPQQQ